jgi:hypothetical protein
VFPGIASWAEGIRTIRDLLTPFSWNSEDNRGQPLAVNPEGTLAITVLSGDEVTGKVGQGQPRTSAGHGPATVEFVDANTWLWPELEADAKARRELERSRAKNTWVLLMHRDVGLGQVRCELSHPTGMDQDKRIVSWSERIILAPVEFEPTPETLAIDEGGPDDGEITIDIKRRA